MATSPELLEIFGSGKRSRYALEKDNQENQPTSTPPQLQATLHPGLNEGSVEMTQFSLEKVRALKDGCNTFVALVLVNNPPKVNLDPHQHNLKKMRLEQERPKCVDAGIGIQAVDANVGVQVRGSKEVEYFDGLLIRKTYLSYLMQPIPADTKGFEDKSITATKIIVDGQEYQVVVVDGCDYCLAVLDGKKWRNSYNFSLTSRPGVLELNIWRLPLCGHSRKDDSICLQCVQKVVYEPVEVPLLQLESGRELWRGNWGEVWAATWCLSNAEGAFDLSPPQQRSVACKRIFNVTCDPSMRFKDLSSLEVKDPVDVKEGREFVYFRNRKGSLILHERGVVAPLLVTDSHGLRECFSKRWEEYSIRENQMREAEIMRRLGGVPSEPPDSVQAQFLLLDAFGIDEYNLYMISELLPGASMDKLMKRLPGERVHEATAKHIMQRLFELVFILHELSIAHCDLKLNNIAFRIHPRHLADAALQARVSPLSAEVIGESDFSQLLVVLIDFGQAVCEPPKAPATNSPRAIASSNPPSPPPRTTSIRSFAEMKRADLRCLGRMLFSMVTGRDLPKDLTSEYLTKVYKFLLAEKLLSDEGVQLLFHLLEVGDFSADKARNFVW